MIDTCSGTQNLLKLYSCCFILAVLRGGGGFSSADSSPKYKIGFNIQFQDVGYISIRLQFTICETVQKIIDKKYKIFNNWNLQNFIYFLNLFQKWNVFYQFVFKFMHCSIKIRCQHNVFFGSTTLHKWLNNAL